MPLHSVDISVVIRFFLLIGAPRVAPRLNFALAGDVDAAVAIHDHVGQVNANHVLGCELFLESLQGEHLSLAHELADARNRVILFDVEGQHRVGDRAVRYLFVDAKDVATPVAARRHGILGVDGDLGAATSAFETRQAGGIGRDISRTRRDDSAGELVQAFTESKFFLNPLAMPFMAAVQADQLVGAGFLPDVGRAAFWAAVEAVLELVGRGINGGRVGGP